MLVTTAGRPQFLGPCLDSLLAQTLPPSQVVVVDDDPGGGAAELLDAYGPRIVRVRGTGSGKPAAANLGLARAEGDYVWVFDDDDLALPDALERCVQPLDGHPEYGYAFAACYLTEVDDDPGRVGTVLGEVTIPDLSARGPLLPLLESNYLSGASLFGRTSVYREVGGFDESMLRCCDYEMAIRIVRRFEGTRIPGGPTFHYRQHQGDRGAPGDRFPAARIRRKWLEYDQRIFRRLRHELALSELLPPGKALPSATRLAYLERARIMAGKLLVAEAVEDLALAVGAGDGSALDAEERTAIRRLLTTEATHAGAGIIDDRRARRALRRLPRPSPVSDHVRRELNRALLRRRLRRS